MPVILVLRRLSQEDCKFEASLVYSKTLSQKNKVIKKKKKKERKKDKIRRGA
jgi:hypothetical protein